MPILMALTKTEPLCSSRDEITSGDGYESRVVFIKDEVHRMQLVRSGNDFHGVPTNVKMTLDRDGTKMKLSLQIDGKTLLEKELNGTDVLEYVKQKQVGKIWPALRDKLGIKAGPYAWVADSFIQGSTLDSACKAAAVAALTYACQAGTLATGNPVVAGAGQIGCAYLSGWVVNQAWPKVKEAAKWLSDNVPGLKEAWDLASDIWEGGQDAWKKTGGEVLSGLKKTGEGFADLIGF